MKKLVIVESPTKAKTISKFLGNEYVVKASMGHIRDLPENASDIPAKYKKDKWARIGINVQKDFEPLYVVNSKKKKVVKELKTLLDDSSELILATDQDREGEAIAWHLNEVLKPTVPVKRMIFHEITKDAIDDSFNHPTKINQKVVEAQEARRFLDRLVGYTISPLLWKKVKFGLSAGRVQSVALKIIVEREKLRRLFIRSNYYSIHTKFKTSSNEIIVATLDEVDEKKVVTSSDFDGETGVLKKTTEKFLLTENNVISILESIRKEEFIVKDVTKKEVKRYPKPPFVTSTLQIDANRKLGFSSKQTMQVAQKLYEKGLITYMRTDSTHIADSAMTSLRSKIKSQFGEKYLNKQIIYYKTKSKGAQEAHEAIRPAGNDFNAGHMLGLIGEELSLYNMILNRTLASQMLPSIQDQTTIEIISKNEKFIYKSTGSIVVFDGYLKAYGISKDENILPNVNPNEELDIDTSETIKHETLPPARFNDASIVKILEKEGIGRPSTYASIISTLVTRGYILRNNNQLIPTFVGFCVSDFMKSYFTDLVDEVFTADMENKLDDIEEGKILWKNFLTDFYLGDKGLESSVEKKESTIDPKISSIIELSGIDKKYEIHVGKFGPYIRNLQKEDETTSIPDGMLPGEINNKDIEKIFEIKNKEDKPILVRNNIMYYVKQGRFGTYISSEKDGTIINYSVPKFVDLNNISNNDLIKIIEMPYLIGKYEDNEVRVGYGRFGGYLKYDDKFYSIKDSEVFGLTIEEAIKIIQSKAESKSVRISKTLKNFGKYKGKNLMLMNGKYGKYMKWGVRNIKIDNSVSFENLDIKDVVKQIKI